MPAAKDEKSSGKRDDAQQPNPASGPAWDPAAVPPAGGASLEEEEQRQFHATHFTADPRGAAMAGKPPPGRRGSSGPRSKHRGGTPPDESARTERNPRPKRRGGAPPAPEVDPSTS